MAVFNVACLGGKVDQETGCYRPNCDENGTFEACRQSFYLKQQNQILKQGSEQQAAITTSGDQKIIEQQNQQITQLIQSSDRAAHQIQNLYLINIALTAVIFAIACLILVAKFIKRKRK